MKKIFLILALLFSITCQAQDFAFGRKMVDTPSSSYFWGRGYTKDGMQKAAEFLASQFREYKGSSKNTFSIIVF
jgi:hypothetical protein